MKIIFFTSYTNDYLKYFYNKYKNINFDELPYSSHLDLIIDDYMGVLGSNTRHAKKQGHDASLLVCNDEALQRKWERENNIEFSESSWQFTLPLEQLKLMKPDVFLIPSMFSYYGNFIKEAHKYCKKIASWIACPIPANLKLNDIDIIFSSTMYFVDLFRSKGLKSELVTVAFDGDILKHLKPDTEADISFSFIGSLSGYHSKRDYYLDKLIKETDIQLFTKLGKGSVLERLKDIYRSEWPGNLQIYLPRLFAPLDLASRNHGQVWGLDMHDAIKQSKIVFNAHIDIAGEYVGNMRMYEVTGNGSLLLTDTGKNMEELFEPEVEVVTYKSPEEAIEKYNYLINNEEKRKQIAKAGQLKTLNVHNMQNHVRKMLTFLENLLIS
ncbi:MAG: hypothetical protein JWP37_4579 [Mucilaginibacter sp.]|nr:hypothetical protein [Mucilaginibacter sp.]